MRRFIDAGVLLRIGSAVLLLLAVAGCHIKLVSDYDEEFVKAVSNTQKEVGALLQNLRNPPTGYDTSYKANVSNYNKIDVDLNNLAVLAGAHEHNDQSVAQVNTLTDLVHDLEKRHQAGPMSPAYLEQKQKDINLAISIVIHTENDKKTAK